jgi:hypothetical protein
MLMKSTVKESNFTKIDEIADELHRISKLEETCHNHIAKKKQISGSFGYAILTRKDMKYLYEKFDAEIIVTVIRHITNELAEESGKIGITVYLDNPKTSNLVQFKMRRAHGFKDFDLRKALKILSISDGGGHEGAIAFRFPESDVKDLKKYLLKMIEKLKNEIA